MSNNLDNPQLNTAALVFAIVLVLALLSPLLLFFFDLKVFSVVLSALVLIMCLANLVIQRGANNEHVR